MTLYIYLYFRVFFNYIPNSTYITYTTTGSTYVTGGLLNFDDVIGMWNLSRVVSESDAGTYFF
jgi:hypothetical protein